MKLKFFKPASTEQVKHIHSAGFLLSEEEAMRLPTSALFTGDNGQWYMRTNLHLERVVKATQISGVEQIKIGQEFNLHEGYVMCLYLEGENKFHPVSEQLHHPNTRCEVSYVLPKGRYIKVLAVGDVPFGAMEAVVSVYDLPLFLDEGRVIADPQEASQYLKKEARS